MLKEENEKAQDPSGNVKLSHKIYINQNPSGVSPRVGFSLLNILPLRCFFHQYGFKIDVATPVFPAAQCCGENSWSGRIHHKENAVRDTL